MSTYKILGQIVPIAVTLDTLYTVPLGKETVTSTLVICNMGVSTKYRIAVRPQGEVINPKHYIVYDSALNQYDSAFLTLGLSLSANDVISVYSETGNVTFNLYGTEI